MLQQNLIFNGLSHDIQDDLVTCQLAVIRLVYSGCICGRLADIVDISRDRNAELLNTLIIVMNSLRNKVNVIYFYC
jgi:hypothetical protein